jgi:hypothetical protein
MPRSPDIPIACTLTDTEMRERRRTLLDAFRNAVLETTPVPLGYAFRLEPTSEALTQLLHLIDLERQCCPFLTFKIIVGAGNQPFTLEITGPPEAQVMIADFFA